LNKEYEEKKTELSPEPARRPGAAQCRDSGCLIIVEPLDSTLSDRILSGMIEQHESEAKTNA
jgi:hypothetical protein